MKYFVNRKSNEEVKTEKECKIMNKKYCIVDNTGAVYASDIRNIETAKLKLNDIIKSILEIPQNDFDYIENLELEIIEQ